VATLCHHTNHFITNSSEEPIVLDHHIATFDLMAINLRNYTEFGSFRANYVNDQSGFKIDPYCLRSFNPKNPVLVILIYDLWRYYTEFF